MTWFFGDTCLDMLSNDDSLGVEDIGDVNGIPTPRGSNPEIPLREGRVHVAKLFDQRVISLGMWLVGSSPADFEARLDGLKKLVGNRRRQLLKRVMTGGSVRQVYAEVTGNLSYTRVGPTAGRFVIDFMLAEPFFRSEVLFAPAATSIAASPKTFTINNGGTAADRSALILLNGTLSNVKITNLTNNVWVSYAPAISGGAAVIIDVANFTAKLGATSVLGDVLHSGDSYFMVLEPDSNTIQVESSTLGGSVQFKFYPPYL